jgi:hypothetical protein
MIGAMRDDLNSKIQMQNQEKRGTCPPSIDSYREKKDKA